MQRTDAGKAGRGPGSRWAAGRGCLRVLLGAALALAVASSAWADPDDERARALWPETLRQVLEGYAAYERGDAAGAIASWGPVASDAPHRVQYLLASLLLAGRGTEANPALAVDILREAAGHGHADGQYLLGLALRATGAGAEAARWLARAARQEHGYARFALGRIYEEGDGVAQDPFEAYVHYARAARLGHPDAHAPRRGDVAATYARAAGRRRRAPLPGAVILPKPGRLAVARTSSATTPPPRPTKEYGTESSAERGCRSTSSPNAGCPSLSSCRNEHSIAEMDHSDIRRAAISVDTLKPIQRAT